MPVPAGTFVRVRICGPSEPFVRGVADGSIASVTTDLTVRAPASAEREGPARSAIEVHDLVKRYRKADRNAVDGISFAVGPGEFFALLGPNGAGKTTTLSILTTTLVPTDGRAWIDGLDVVTDAAAVRQRVGIIFQRPSLDKNLTGEENVRFHAILYGLYPYAPSYRLMAAGYRRQVEDWAELLGLGRDIFRPVRTYSGGMLRKLEIVRSLVHRPAVLFLDEPTTGLDAPSRRALWSYLRDVRAANETTIVLTSHYLEEAEQADRICVIDAGKVIATGSPADLTAALASEYLLVDARDRPRLRTELVGLGLEPSGDGPFRIDVSTANVHGLLRRIETPLTVVRTHAPSLEDAYLEIVSRAELGDEALGRATEPEPDRAEPTDGTHG
jgi:ABC-2 type transport system ATP-binding protein